MSDAPYHTPTTLWDSPVTAERLTKMEWKQDPSDLQTVITVETGETVFKANSLISAYVVKLHNSELDMIADIERFQVLPPRFFKGGSDV